MLVVVVNRVFSIVAFLEIVLEQIPSFILFVDCL